MDKECALFTEGGVVGGSLEIRGGRTREVGERREGNHYLAYRPYWRLGCLEVQVDLGIANVGYETIDMAECGVSGGVVDGCCWVLPSGASSISKPD
jgi:hypothetical protein